MNGDFGALFQDGDQIGGFLNWIMSFHLAETSTSGMRSYTVTQWVTRAHPYYWVTYPRSNIFTADYYVYYEERLILVSRNLIKILYKDEPLHRWIDESLEMKLA